MLDRLVLNIDAIKALTGVDVMNWAYRVRVSGSMVPFTACRNRSTWSTSQAASRPAKVVLSLIVCIAIAAHILRVSLQSHRTVTAGGNPRISSSLAESRGICVHEAGWQEKCQGKPRRQERRRGRPNERGAGLVKARPS